MWFDIQRLVTKHSEVYTFIWTVHFWLDHQKYFKGHLLCKIHFYMVFGHKCVLAVCEHIHTTMIKIYPLLIFESPLIQFSLTRPAVLTFTAVWRHISEGRATGVDWQPCIVLVSALSSYAVLHFLHAWESLKHCVM